MEHLFTTETSLSALCARMSGEKPNLSAAVGALLMVSSQGVIVFATIEGAMSELDEQGKQLAGRLQNESMDDSQTIAQEYYAILTAMREVRP